MASKNFSDVDGGHNCHLQVKIGGQLEVKTQTSKSTVLDSGCLITGFLCLGIRKMLWLIKGHTSKLIILDIWVSY